MNPNPSRILVTGANGFVGKALCVEAARRGLYVNALVRRTTLICPQINIISIPNWHVPSEKLARCFEGVDTVFHLAARVHVMYDDAIDPMAEYRRINVDLTKYFLALAYLAGVRRFIYLSSIKVNGEKTIPNHPFTAEDVARPVDPYAISKWEAEQSIIKYCEKHSMHFTIIRPPLVYGPGVGANFLSLLKLMRYPLLLPFRSIDNRRSMIGRTNLVDLLLCAADSPRAQNQVFLASDGVDLSTGDLLAKLKGLMGSKTLLFSASPKLLRFSFSLFGMESIAQRLFDSLELNIQKTIEYLNWHPPQSVDDGLRETVSQFQGLHETRF